MGSRLAALTDSPKYRALFSDADERQSYRTILRSAMVNSLAAIPLSHLSRQIVGLILVPEVGHLSLRLPNECPRPPVHYNGLYALMGIVPRCKGNYNLRSGRVERHATDLHTRVCSHQPPPASRGQLDNLCHHQTTHLSPLVRQPYFFTAKTG